MSIEKFGDQLQDNNPKDQTINVPNQGKPHILDDRGVSATKADDIVSSPIEQGTERKAEIREFVLILIKPLGMREKMRGLIDDILSQHSDVAHKCTVMSTKDTMATHYLPSQYDKEGKPIPYYPAIVNYMSNQVVDVMILEERDDSTEETRDFATRLRKDIIGHTRPDQAQDGTIRRLAVEHDLPFIQYPQMHPDDIIDGINYCTDNLIHCSDSLESALREIKIWFHDHPEIIQRYEDTYSQLTKAKNSTD